MVHKRSKSARERRERKRQSKDSTYDRETGEVINLQEHFLRYEVVPETLGFLNVDSSFLTPVVGLMWLYQGEVLIDRQGTGTVQARPEVFI